MFNILTAQQRNPAEEQTINPVTKDLEFRIHRYHTKSQVPTQYHERIEYINWSCFHPLLMEILGYCKLVLFVKQLIVKGTLMNHQSSRTTNFQNGWLAGRGKQ